MTRTVRDAAIVLDVIAGYDPNDPVTADSYGKKAASYTDFLQRDGLRGLRIGVIRTAVGRDANPSSPDYQEIQAILTQATRDLRGRGAKIVVVGWLPANVLCGTSASGTFSMRTCSGVLPNAKASA